MDGPATNAERPLGLPTWAWLIGITAMLAWHGWLTLSLFGDDPRTALVNDQPIVSGSHPQHLYIGSLGASALANHGMTVVFDHQFQAGWPKTPIFDGGRLAELLLLLGGGSYQPAAYKIGFAVLCMLVPIFILTACKSFDLGHATSLLATLFGLLIWWGPHGRAAIVSGDCELYFGSGGPHASRNAGRLSSDGQRVGVDRRMGHGLPGLVLQPLLVPIALPVLLVYYLSVGVKHEFLTWHVAFWSAEALAFLVNLPWLTDWLDSWWLRTPLPLAADLLAHRTFSHRLECAAVGGSTSRFLAVVL